MADVIVKGMEMPENCNECRLLGEGRWCWAIPVDETQPGATREDKRPDWCPLRHAPDWIGLVLSKYDENKEKSWIRDPVAYTLYEVWKIMDSKVSYRPSGGGDGDG